MSFVQSDDIEIRPEESKNRFEGKRVVETLRLELSNNLSREEIRSRSRSDWFEGTSFALTIDQAERLHEELGKALDFLRGLESQGAVLLRRASK